ncbi:MAG: rhodanese-like domain-containing protein [Natronomonas sp.]
MDRVVSIEWLEEHRTDPDVSVIDVRDEWEFDGIGHVPSAVNVPFDSFRAGKHGEGEAGMLPGAEVFASLLGDAGVGPEDRLVAYDDTHGVFAARLLVTAELYGHDPERLHLLDGDFSAWQRTAETTTDRTDREPTTYPAAFRADGPLVDAETVRDALEDAVVVDVREPWEHEDGHIPGSIQLDWKELIDDESRGLLPTPEIRSLLESRGIVPDRRIILYCNTARRISHTYVVLRHLGYESVDFYEGSLTEWEEIGGEITR